MLGHTVVQLIDNIMVGQLGTAELAAVSLGNSFVFVAMSIGIGFSTAITPMIAESLETKNYYNVRYVFVHGLILCFGLGLILAILVLWAQPLLSQMGQPHGSCFLENRTFLGGYVFGSTRWFSGVKAVCGGFVSDPFGHVCNFDGQCHQCIAKLPFNFWNSRFS